MRRWISIVVVLAASLTLAAAAHAAGLGRLTVLSTLGEPLSAEIEVVSLAPGEDEGISARLAAADLFAQAGIEVNPALNTVRISIERRDKRPYLRITTREPISEPFLDLLIELQWSSGRLVREYTFLLDPPEYRTRRQAIAAAPTPSTPAAVAEKPAPAAEETTPAAEEPKPAAEAPIAAITPAPEATPNSTPVTATPLAPEPAQEKPAAEQAAAEKPAAEKPAAEKPAGANTYEVKRGDTLGAIAKANLPAGVSLNQMLIAIFRANEDAFIRGNVNLVRTGRILNIPEPDAIGTIDREEANRLVKDQHDQWMEYRSRLAAVPAPAEAAAPQQEAAGRIEPKPEAPKPPAPSDQVRLSKTEPGKPAAPASRAAREDDAAARERALQEAQSRTSELEKNVADLQKLLALKNQQLAEMERKAGAKPAPVPPVAQAPAQQPAAPAQQPAAPAQPGTPKPAAEAPKPPAQAPAPVAEAPKPAAEAPKPAAEAPQPAPAAPKPVAPRPVAKKAAPAPEPSIIDEFLDNPMYLALLGALVLLLIAYFIYSWRRKKNAQARFKDSVLDAAAAGASLGEPTAPASSPTSTKTASQAPSGMDAEEVDPIAEADVYMAYGRDAQAEEILKEALQKDANRTAVHGKLLEIYAHRKDTGAFAQTANKLKNLTRGAGPEWEKAAALGRSIDPRNNLYGGGAGAAEPSPSPAAPSAASAAAPMLDFDLGGTSQVASPAPDISFDEPPKGADTTSVDLDLGATRPTLSQKLPAAPPDQTIATSFGEKSGGLDFNLDLGTEEKKPAPAAQPAAPAAEPSAGLDFDLNLDLDKGEKPAAEPAKVDLSDISLDLGNPSDDATVMAATRLDPGGSARWQEVATKLDLAKAYEEMGDKDGARELLKEVMKDGDSAQRGTAEQLLAKLG
ncbi:MAG TPA: FimV/HubP family polar landmark protein [Burkholderiales bacterium]|nr:FimV/HubP family polar landmark protein [Burkholderiales bacterium]